MTHPFPLPPSTLTTRMTRFGVARAGCTALPPAQLPAIPSPVIVANVIVPPRLNPFLALFPRGLLFNSREARRTAFDYQTPSSRCSSASNVSWIGSGASNDHYPSFIPLFNVRQSIRGLIALSTSSHFSALPPQFSTLCLF